MTIESIVRVLQAIKNQYYSFRIMLYDLITDTEVQGNPQKIQPCLFTGEGKIVFENNVRLGYWPSPYFWSTYCHFEARNKNSTIMVGSDVIINNNFACIACGKISIGKSTLIGTNVFMLDFDGHGLEPSTRLKGVTIGDNSVIATGSVVITSIPANVVAAGNPCKVIKPL